MHKLQNMSEISKHILDMSNREKRHDKEVILGSMFNSGDKLNMEGPLVTNKVQLKSKLLFHFQYYFVWIYLQQCIKRITLYLLRCMQFSSKLYIPHQLYTQRLKRTYSVPNDSTETQNTLPKRGTQNTHSNMPQFINVLRFQCWLPKPMAWSWSQTITTGSRYMYNTMLTV